MWTVLVPFSASYRHSHPLVASLGVILGLFLGFITKETIVFLAPFPLLLAWLDWKNKTLQPAFYLGLVGFGMALGSIYLGYFWAKFGNPFYRFDSIQDGHYVSEFTYADKSGWMMLKRLTILPIVTFVERAYWIWLVFSLPALLQIRKNPHSTAATFGLALLSLLACFWLMSTNFRFYNPLYLNPRHLIILVPVFSFLIATGWEEWKSNPRLISLMTTLILLGAGISLVQLDWKMAGFQLAFLPWIWYSRMPMKEFGFAVVLLLPALASIRYQQQIKSYPDFINTLTREVKNSENQSIIITNNFIDFSKEVLLPGDVLSQNLLFPIEKLDTLRHLAPAEFRVLIYDYYQHAYPKEQTDVDELEQWLQSATLLSEDCFGKVCIQRYRSMKPE
jgi:hypothetical protein